MCKNTDINISRNLSGKYSQKPLDHAKLSGTDLLKIVSKWAIQQQQLVTWIVTKLLILLQTSQKLHNRIIQKQLQMNMTKKCQKKDLYLQKKDRKLLMIWD